MAENRYGGYRREGWRESEGSIFSDDDDRWGRGSGRWSSEHGRERGGGGDDDRGFFERAGDEVRSWFGDDEAERRREMDMHRDDARSAFSSDQDRQRGGSRDYGRRYEGGSTGPTGGYGSSWGSRSNETFGRDRSGIRGGQSGRETGGWGGGGFDGSQGFDRGSGSRFESRGGRGGQGRSSSGGGRSQWDENYQRWRSQQLEQFDREYDDYCRERQRQFDQDFDSWRNSRLTEGGSSGTPSLQTGGGSATGYSGDTSRSQGNAGSGLSGSSESAGTTAAGGGTGSAMESSTGSTGAAPGPSRGGRSRS